MEVNRKSKPRVALSIIHTDNDRHFTFSHHMDGNIPEPCVILPVPYTHNGGMRISEEPSVKLPALHTHNGWMRIF